MISHICFAVSSLVITSIVIAPLFFSFFYKFHQIKYSFLQNSTTWQGYTFQNIPVLLWQNRSFGFYPIDKWFPQHNRNQSCFQTHKTLLLHDHLPPTANADGFAWPIVAKVLSSLAVYG